MAKKKTKKKTTVTQSEKRKCGVCGKRGHNKRSHEPGGKFR